MRQRLLITFLLLGMTVGVSAQTVIADLTDSKLTNSDFMADTPLTETVKTYDYDMPDDGAGAEGKGLYGMQPVTGWTANNPSTNTKVADRTDGTNARAAGVFAYSNDADDTQVGLGGAYYPPYQSEGQCLGIASVWGGTPIYSQEVSLPAGDYMMVVKACNTAGTGTLTNNLCGFSDGGDNVFLSSKKSFVVDDDEFELDSIIFRLESDVTGKVQLGFQYGGGSGSTPHIFIDCVRLYQIDSRYIDQAAINEAKAELYELIQTAISYNVEYAASKAVYDNPDATLDEVKAAIESQKEINASGVTDLSAYFITNPHFNFDEPITDGVCTYAGDCAKNNVDPSHFSMQPVTGWTRTKTNDGCASGVFSIGSGAMLGASNFKVPDVMSDGSSEGKVLGFVTCWTMSVQYTQSTTLPAGRYTLSMSYYNVGGTNAIAKNLIGFIADDGTEYLAQAKTFPVGQWTTEEVSFELTEQTTGYFSLGYTSTNTGSGNMPHFFTDGISLVYVGTGIDASYMALQSAVATGNSVEGRTFLQSLKDQLNEALDHAQELLDNGSDDADANSAAALAITSLMNDVYASANAFDKLREFYDGDYQEAYDKYENTAFQATLDVMGDDIMQQLEEEATWTADEIDSCINSLLPKIKAYIQETFDTAVETGVSDGDIDISLLFETLGCTYSTTSLTGANVVDKQWNYGDATTFKTLYGTMEVWNKSPFKVSQTLSDMPAGTYTLSTRALYRYTDQSTNYDLFMQGLKDDHVFVFAGSLKTPVSNVGHIASNDVSEFTNGYSEVSTGVYVPNSQRAAHDVFENIFRNYDDVTYKSVQTVLTEKGDLVFGVMADEMQANSWGVWYTFEIKYNPVIDESLIRQELAALTEQAGELLNETAVENVEKAYNGLTNAYDLGNESLEASIDEVKAAIGVVKNAIEYASQCAALIEQLNDDAAYILYLANNEYNYDSSDETIFDLFETIDQQYFESNEQILEIDESLAQVWGDYVLGQDLASATEEEPVDISGIILNNNFDYLQNAKFWTFSEGMEQKHGYVGSSYTGETSISRFVEMWKPSGAALSDGDVSQTISAVLPRGSYSLECDGHAINQSNVIDIEGAYLMATNGKQVWTTSMAVEGTTANPHHFAVRFTSDGTTPTTVGLRIEGTNASWITGDNFKLYCLGLSESRGDVNGDGEVDIKDVVAVINHIAGTASYPNANVNGDTDDQGNDIVDINDVVAIINEMAGN